MRIAALLVAVLSALGPADARAQSNWDRYRPSTFASIVEQHKASVEGSGDSYSTQPFPSRVRVTWTGQIRAIDGERKTFLARYFTMIRRNDLAAFFQREVLVREGERALWVPIQEGLVAHLEKEVAPGKNVLVFATWMGAIKTLLGHEWIFGINEFERIP